MVESAAPGWYPAYGMPGMLRYWDGTQWTEHTAPVASPSVQNPGWAPSNPYGFPPPPFSPAPVDNGSRTAIIAGVALLMVIVIIATAVAIAGSRSKVVTGPVGPGGSPLPTSRDASTPAYLPQLETSGDPKLVSYPPTAVEIDPSPSSVPAALYAVPPGPDVVTPAAARAVTAAIWSIRENAIAAQDRHTLAKIETGSALAVDAGRGCGCGHEDRFGSASHTITAVKHSAAFPASFYAQTQTTLNGTPWNSVLVFTRTSRAHPWRLAFAGGGQPLAGPESVFPFALRADGFVVANDPKAVQRGTMLRRDLASYWQDAKDGRPQNRSGENFAPGGLTDQWFEQIALNRQGQINRSNNLTGFYRFAPAPNTATYVVALNNGSSLICASIVEQLTFVAPAGSRLTQGSDRAEWGPDVPPGNYRATTETDLYTPCFDYASGAPLVTVNGVIPPDTVTTIGVP